MSAVPTDVILLAVLHSALLLAESLRLCLRGRLAPLTYYSSSEHEEWRPRLRPRYPTLVLLS